MKSVCVCVCVFIFKISNDTWDKNPLSSLFGMITLYGCVWLLILIKILIYCLRFYSHRFLLQIDSFWVFWCWRSIYWCASSALCVVLFAVVTVIYMCAFLHLNCVTEYTAECTMHIQRAVRNTHVWAFVWVCYMSR